MRRAIRRGWPTGALDILKNPDNKRYLTNAEEGQLRAEIAHAYFIFGVDPKAIREARHAIGKSDAWLGYWAGGLAAWRSGQHELAGSFSEVLLICQRFPLTGFMQCGSILGAPSQISAGQPPESVEYLTIAAQEVDSFYGVVAREALGQKATLSFDLPPFDDNVGMPWLTARPGGQRMFALLQIGKTHLAERELRYLWMEMPPQNFTIARCVWRLSMAWQACHFVLLKSSEKGDW